MSMKREMANLGVLKDWKREDFERGTSIILVELFGSDGKPRRRERRTERKGLQKPQNSGEPVE